MNIMNIDKILDDFRKGKITKKETSAALKNLSFIDLDFAKIDTHRHLRKGFGEVIYCEGKTLEQIVKIISKIKLYENILLTRASEKIYKTLKKTNKKIEFNKSARTIVINRKSLKQKSRGTILIMCAGTSDIPVAEEAYVTSELMGNNTKKLYDVGVAGIHRLLKNMGEIEKASAIVAVAGMDGALPSVVGGIAPCPIIAVPTSIGYGANFNGIAPLLTMLNSCAPGVAVVNINNGFGAGFMASMINKAKSE